MAGFNPYRAAAQRHAAHRMRLERRQHQARAALQAVFVLHGPVPGLGQQHLVGVVGMRTGGTGMALQHGEMRAKQHCARPLPVHCRGRIHRTLRIVHPLHLLRRVAETVHHAPSASNETRVPAVQTPLQPYAAYRLLPSSAPIPLPAA
ncbi:hypothetical protein D3C71_989490 [compost metagenome]